VFDKIAWALIIAGIVCLYFAIMAVIDKDIKSIFIFIIILFIIALISKGYDNYRNGSFF